MQENLIIRPLGTLEEYLRCAEFQEEIWGEGFSEKVPSAILMIANRLGGLTAGAFDEDGELQGFVFGLTGVLDGVLVHWSDMLGVRSGLRDMGLGTRLKAYQREILLGRGVEEMRWTFDPLQGRNAYVNFSKLGIISLEYVENMYGQTDSPLHRGVGTDRLIATWRMGSERVAARLAGGAQGPSLDEWNHVPRALGSGDGRDLPEPGEPDLSLEGPFLLTAIPADIDDVMARDMGLAVRWREATRRVFAHYVGRGYVVREFLRGEGVSFYLLADAEPADMTDSAYPGGGRAGSGQSDFTGDTSGELDP